MFVGLMYVTSILCNKKQTFVFSKRDGKDLWKTIKNHLQVVPEDHPFLVVLVLH